MNKKKNFLLATLFLALISAVLGCTYYYILGTPQYSLYNLSQAVKSNNLTVTEQYVDIDSISEQITDTSIEKLYATLDEQPVEEDDFFGPDFYKGIMDLMVPAIENQLTESIQSAFSEYVESSKEESESLALFDNYKDRSMIDLLTADDIEFDRQGNTTLLTLRNLKLPESEEAFSIVLKMEKRIGRIWTVTEISNLEEIIDQFLDPEELTEDLNSEDI